MTQSKAGLTEQALSRASGTPLIHGNRIRLLRNGDENYPAWIAAIESARQWVHFETYVIHDDAMGQRFADVLTAKAREGVQVRLIYDWFGSSFNAPRRFWKRLSKAGVDVRCFNPPRLDSPLGWTSRDHRKLLSVDGRIGYIAGLCIGQMWMGDPARKRDPWRDTGVEIEGPAMADIERCFADTWAVSGSPLPAQELQSSKPNENAGDYAIRVVGAVPHTGGLYRLDQLITTFARKSIWLADAYFVGTATYIQALRSAAQSGVDVRLLMPGANDVPIMRAAARAGLRPLLEAGVRVFEWNGSMMHAKTAVADGKWARVGSTNLNIDSWFQNWELDVIIEDERFARQMEEMYLADLTQATEIVLDARRRRPMTNTAAIPSDTKPRRARPGSRTAAGVMRLGYSVGASITNRRELGPAEAVIMFWSATILAVLAFVAGYWPRAIAYPACALCLWLGVSLLMRAFKLRKTGKRKRGIVD